MAKDHGSRWHAVICRHHPSSILRPHILSPNYGLSVSTIARNFVSACSYGTSCLWNG
jgi:hypothetical protein